MLIAEAMSYVRDWAANPLGIIDQLFEESENEVTCETVRDYFSKLLEDRESLMKVPSLNDVASHDLQSGSLVRFRCMIQDMFDPEFCLSRFTIQQKANGDKRICCGLFRDIISSENEEEIDFDAPGNKTLDRQILYCIPIPGENVWAKEAYSKMHPKELTASSAASVSRPKRSLGEGDDIGCETSVTRSDQETMDTEDASESSTKRSKCSSSDVNTTIKSSILDKHIPMSSEQGTACILKVYDLSHELKLNDMIEVIGVLSVDPALAFINERREESSFLSAEPMMDFAEEQEARNPPPSLVPRIHAILVNHMSHNNPYLPPNIAADDDTEAAFEAVREELLAILEQMLLGDRLAAEYLLCHLISTVYRRQDVVALGKFSLNLSKCPNDALFITQIYKVISLLVAKSHLLSLTLSNINKQNFVPRKDYKLNRLQMGILQMCARTHLVVDETALEPGHLDANGVNNMTALGNVITWQRLDYDFDFHKQAFPTDVVALVLSEGKSMLTCDCHIPTEAQSSSSRRDELFNGIFAYLTPALLEQIRTYLGKAQLSAYNVSTDMQKFLENDFVGTRKDDAKAMTVDDFHTLLTLTRLLSLSHGKKSPTEEMWIKAKAMEHDRKQRIISQH